MGDADFDADFIGQGLEILFEKVVPGTVASTAITQHQNGGSLRVVPLPVGIPPVAKAVTGEFAGIMAGSQVQVADIALHIVEPMRDDDALSEALEVMVIDLQLFPSIQLSIPIEVPQIFLFFWYPC